VGDKPPHDEDEKLYGYHSQTKIEPVVVIQLRRASTINPYFSTGGNHGIAHLLEGNHMRQMVFVSRIRSVRGDERYEHTKKKENEPSQKGRAFGSITGLCDCIHDMNRCKLDFGALAIIHGP
jgi:hypothetical protein